MSTSMNSSASTTLDPATAIGFVVDSAGVTEAWREIAHGTDDPSALVESLVSAGLTTEAIRCIAVAIPARQNVWWAWVSARHTLVGAAADGVKDSPRLHELLGMIEQWIAAPDDQKRRAIWAVALSLGIKHPVTLAAAALYFSGGSIAEAEGAAPVPAPPGMVATFVAATVTVSTLQGPPEQMDDRVRASVAQGMEIITKLGGWVHSISHVRQELSAHRQPQGA
jgi:hypothetical protein